MIILYERETIQCWKEEGEQVFDWEVRNVLFLPFLWWSAATGCVHITLVNGSHSVTLTQLSSSVLTLCASLVLYSALEMKWDSYFPSDCLCKWLGAHSKALVKALNSFSICAHAVIIHILTLARPKRNPYRWEVSLYSVYAEAAVRFSQWLREHLLWIWGFTPLH